MIMKKTYMMPETLVVKLATDIIMLDASGAGVSGLSGVTKEEYDGTTPVNWARGGGLWDDDED